jgi:glutamyl-tRNA synthetase
MMTDTSQPVVTRFAPSPTGFLHIGGARTALFNWLYARARGGKFLLRIEDTDRARSTDAATQAILDGLTWLGLDWDGPAISQFAQAPRHAQVAHQMLATGHAYKCFATQDEIAAFRDAAKAAGTSTLFPSPWRDTPADEHPDAPYAIRLKAPRDGQTVINDAVQGQITVNNAHLDDMILLRSDGTPTYMLAVVVDDHDMGVTHVIRGDDHLNNAARQVQIYHAMGWDVPVWAHIPLIHGPDGKKLSKRHGALGVMEYAEMGYPAPAMRNYLARLGWSHGDDELFTDAQARDWFDLKGIGKSPARLDLKKLAHVAGWHIAQTADDKLVTQVDQFLSIIGQPTLSQAQKKGLQSAMYCIKDRAKSLPDLIEKSEFILKSRPIRPDEKSSAALDDAARHILQELTKTLETVTWERNFLEETLNHAAGQHGLKFGQLAAPLRAALVGRTATPSVFDMMIILGRTETLARLNDAA